MADPIVITVLKSGGEYKPEHVYRLRDMLKGRLLYCLTDHDDLCPSVISIPLRYEWAGWWSKLELFRPDIVTDMLYMDLDTSVVGDISDLLSVGRVTMLSDFTRPHEPASGLMYLPATDRDKVWSAWLKDPHGAMVRAGAWGDQAFIGGIYRRYASRFQDLLPGQVVSYKVHCERGVPRGARIVCFHGKPRPWEL